MPQPPSLNRRTLLLAFALLLVLMIEMEAQDTPTQGRFFVASAVFALGKAATKG
jgi:hypothetical protein